MIRRPIECPECKRQYWYDFIMAELTETIASERKDRPFCSYCQKSSK